MSPTHPWLPRASLTRLAAPLAPGFTASVTMHEPSPSREQSAAKQLLPALSAPAFVGLVAELGLSDSPGRAAAEQLLPALSAPAFVGLAAELGLSASRGRAAAEQLLPALMALVAAHGLSPLRKRVAAEAPSPARAASTLVVPLTRHAPTRVPAAGMHARELPVPAVIALSAARVTSAPRAGGGVNAGELRRVRACRVGVPDPPERATVPSIAACGPAVLPEKVVRAGRRCVARHLWARTSPLRVAASPAPADPAEYRSAATLPSSAPVAFVSERGLVAVLAPLCPVGPVSELEQAFRKPTVELSAPAVRGRVAA